MTRRRNTVFICFDHDHCNKHNLELHGYPCYACELEWSGKYPKTLDALLKFTRGTISRAAYSAIYNEEHQAPQGVTQ